MTVTVAANAESGTEPKRKHAKAGRIAILPCAGWDAERWSRANAKPLQLIETSSVWNNDGLRHRKDLPVLVHE
jgi:hypothetical protein